MDLPDTTPPELAPYTFLVGHWVRGDEVDDWVAAGDVLFGLRYRRGAYEVTTIRSGSQVEWVSCPADQGCTALAITAPDNGVLAFPGPAVGFERGGAGRLVVHASGKPRSWRSKDRVPAPELEQADRAFHDAVVTGDALKAWVAAFDPDVGYQWSESAQTKVPAGPAMAELMVGTLTGGRLDWTPTASGLGPSGDVGWTVGDWTWTASGASEPAQRGAYVTVWRRAADGSWKVWFDTGDPLDADTDRADPGGAG